MKKRIASQARPVATLATSSLAAIRGGETAPPPPPKKTNDQPDLIFKLENVFITG